MCEITDFLNLDGCVMKTEDGITLASLHEEEDGFIRVDRAPACTIGMYFYLLDYLHRMGINVR